MTSRQPNLLLIMTDQQRADTIGAAGNAVIQTPHLDRLCREGVRFASAYTESPVCVSARAIVMTGRLPHRNGVFDNRYLLPPDADTLPRRLTDAGYFTQAIGKMYFAPTRETHGFSRLWLSEEIPERVEDDEFLQDLHAAGYRHVEEPHGVRHELYYIPQVSQLPEDLHTTAWTAQRTIQFLQERAVQDTPFFCWTSFIKPHPPFDPPAPWYHLYRTTDMPLPVRDRAELAWQTYYHRMQNRLKWMEAFPDDNLLRTMKAYYYASISFIDAQIGRILDTLDRLGLRENTLVLFVSDHGEYMGDHYAFGKRGYHESAAHIPFILSQPGTLPAGEVRSQLVGLADVAATLLAAAGVEVAGLDGLDLAPVARDAACLTRQHLIGQLGERDHGLYLAMDDRWKYIYSAPDQREILLRYDTESELRDYAADPAQRQTRETLRGVLLDRFAHDGYTEPLAGKGWQPSDPLVAPWEQFDEFENIDVVGRGWQYAIWTRSYPIDRRGSRHVGYDFVTDAPEVRGQGAAATR